MIIQRSETDLASDDDNFPKDQREARSTSTKLTRETFTLPIYIQTISMYINIKAKIHFELWASFESYICQYISTHLNTHLHFVCTCMHWMRFIIPLSLLLFQPSGAIRAYRAAVSKQKVNKGNRIDLKSSFKAPSCFYIRIPCSRHWSNFI